jgi:uncharacterized protein YutD
MKILYNFTIINSLTSDIKINIDSSKYTGGEFSQAYKNATNSEKFDSEVLGAIQDILVLYQGNNQIRERGFLLATAHQEFKPYKLNLMASCEPLIPENNMIIGELLSVS